MTMVSKFKSALSVTILMSLISTISAANMHDVMSDMYLTLLVLLLLVCVVGAVDNSSDGIKLPVFGSGVKFMVWWTRFEAYARIKKFWKVLTEGQANPLA